MLFRSAETVAAHVSPERLAAGAIYPNVTDLRVVSREIAIQVASEALRAGLSPLPGSTDVAALIDAAIWWPAYAPYRRATSMATGSSPAAEG